VNNCNQNGEQHFVDVVGYDKITNKPVEYYQIGKAALEGAPVPREVNAIYVIQTELAEVHYLTYAGPGGLEFHLNGARGKRWLVKG